MSATKDEKLFFRVGATGGFILGIILDVLGCLK